MKSDIEIARAAPLKRIAEIAAKIGAPKSALRPFGRFIAKLEYDFLDGLSNRPDGKLVSSLQSAPLLRARARRQPPLASATRSTASAGIR